VKRKFNSSFLLDSNYLIYIFFGVLTYTNFNNFEKIKILYGDDSWVVVGSSYTNIFEKLVCCTITHPVSSIFHQGLFNLSSSTDMYLKSLFSLFVIGTLFVVLYNNTDTPQELKFIFSSLIITSPMLLNYSVRSKPYVVEGLFSVYVLFLISKTLKKNVFDIKYLFIFLFFTFFSLANIFVLIAFFLVLIRNKLLNFNIYKYQYLLFALLSSFVVFLSYQRRTNNLENFWTAYFAPTEGGLTLFFRWFYFSIIRIFSSSNKLDLGALNFSISISLVLFLFGVFYLYQNQIEILEFIFYTIFINLLVSVLQIFPFGGSRLNIYYMTLVIYVCSCGVLYILNLTKNYKNIFFIIFVTFSFININSSSASYNQTIRSFDQNIASEIIDFVNTSNENILIYHGSLWTIGTHHNKKIRMEDLNYPFIGSGVSGIPTPTFKNKNIHVVCQKYEIDDLCKNKILDYLKINNIDVLYLVGIHIREYQYKPYLNALREHYKYEEIILKSTETELLKFNN
tara:strand:+ start:103 stop:1632 length:1530 start_codon:yes stop_codon:yes gene_type:complete